MEKPTLTGREWRPEVTGGDCTGLVSRAKEGEPFCYLLVTKLGWAQQPRRSGELCTLGVYDEDGDELVELQEPVVALREDGEWRITRDLSKYDAPRRVVASYQVDVTLPVGDDEVPAKNLRELLDERRFEDYVATQVLRLLRSWDEDGAPETVDVDVTVLL